MRDDQRDIRHRRRRAVIGLHQAEYQLLAASQGATRRAAMRSLHAALSARHGSAVSAVLAKFADRRAALTHGDADGRAAALKQLSADENCELARLALEHAAEKRALRQSTLMPMVRQQLVDRRLLRIRNRRQRIMLAIQLAAPRLRCSTSKPHARLVQRINSKPAAFDRTRRRL